MPTALFASPKPYPPALHTRYKGVDVGLELPVQSLYRQSARQNRVGNEKTGWVEGGGGRAAPDTRIRWPGPEPVPSQTGTESPQSAPGTVEAVLVQARGNSRTVTGTGPGWRRGTRIWISPAPREEADRNCYQQAARDTDGR